MRSFHSKNWGSTHLRKSIPLITGSQRKCKENLSKTSKSSHLNLFNVHSTLWDEWLTKQINHRQLMHWGSQVFYRCIPRSELWFRLQGTLFIFKITLVPCATWKTVSHLHAERGALLYWEGITGSRQNLIISDFDWRLRYDHRLHGWWPGPANEYGKTV